MIKKIFFLLLIFIACFSLFSKRSLLIDFNKLKANGNGSDLSKSLAIDDQKMVDYTNHDPENRLEHMPTLIDYSLIAGSSFSDSEKATMMISLSAYNWEIEINSSAKSAASSKNSTCLEWHTKAVDVLVDQDHPPNEKPQGYTILGIRIYFSFTPNNNWALIKPPFDIPIYENIETDYKGNKLDPAQMTYKGDKFENGYGVIKNTGIIKKIEMRVYGCNFKNSIAILLQNEKEEVREYDFPTYLDYDGWRKIEWINPNYIENVAHRDLFIVPLYPRYAPYLKINAFRIYRPADQLGGDFITYIKDVYVTHDEAVLDTQNAPIDHEEVWKLLQKKVKEIKERELKKLGYKQILRFLEKLKMHKEDKK